jgi:hypothetical protein
VPNRSRLTVLGCGQSDHAASQPRPRRVLPCGDAPGGRDRMRGFGEDDLGESIGTPSRSPCRPHRLALLADHRRRARGIDARGVVGLPSPAHQRRALGDRRYEARRARRAPCPRGHRDLPRSANLGLPLRDPPAQALLPRAAPSRSRRLRPHQLGVPAVGLVVPAPAAATPTQQACPLRGTCRPSPSAPRRTPLPRDHRCLAGESCTACYWFVAEALVRGVATGRRTRLCATSELAVVTDARGSTRSGPAASGVSLSCSLQADGAEPRWQTAGHPSDQRQAPSAACNGSHASRGLGSMVDLSELIRGDMDARHCPLRLVPVHGWHRDTPRSQPRPRYVY